MKRILLSLAVLAFTAAGILLLADQALAAVFSDIDDAETAAAVTILYDLDVVDGFDDGGYHPGEAVTRAQFCKLVLLTEGRADELAAYQHMTLFSDVPSAHWATAYVNLASRSGMINGYGNGNFGPDDTITYAQAITILLRELGYTTADIGYYWPGDYVAFAAALGLGEDLGLSEYSMLNRGDTARLLVQFLHSEDTSGNTVSSGVYGDIIADAILLDNDALSDDGYDGCALFYIPVSTTTGGSSYKLVYYQQATELDDDLVGCSGSILLDDDDLVAGFSPDGREYTVEQGVLLDHSIGNKQAACWVDDDIEQYRYVSAPSSSLVGCYGYLLLNENDYLTLFAAITEPETVSKEDAEDYDLRSRTPTVYPDEDGDWTSDRWGDISDLLAEDSELILCLDEEEELILVLLTEAIEEEE